MCNNNWWWIIILALLSGECGGSCPGSGTCTPCGSSCGNWWWIIILLLLSGDTGSLFGSTCGECAAQNNCSCGC